MKCPRHGYRFLVSTAAYDLDSAAVAGPPDRIVAMLCVRCGQLPLGLSDETPVAVDVRAAELAAEWQPLGGVWHALTKDEHEGWCDVDRDVTDAYLAGSLAYHILVGHDDEQRAPMDATEPTP